MIVDGRWGDDNGGRLRWLLMGGGLCWKWNMGDEA